MDIQGLAKKMLLIAIKESKYKCGVGVNAFEIIQDMNLDDVTADFVVNYLKTNFYINDIQQCTDDPYPRTFKITGKGVDWVHNYDSNHTVLQTVQHINIGDNYGAVGNNNTIIIDNNFSWRQFDNLIEKYIDKNSSDYSAVQEIRAKLKKAEELNTPISHGYLNKFSSLMQKHSWLSGAVANFLIRWVAF